MASPQPRKRISATASSKVSNSARNGVFIRNIADEDYRYLGSGGNEPGTNVVLGGQLFFLERVPQKAFRNKTV